MKQEKVQNLMACLGDWVLYMAEKKGVIDEAKKKQTGMGFWRTVS